MSGPNGDLYEQFANRYPDVALQASGGVRDVHDLEMLQRRGASAAITGRALLDGRIEPQELKQFLRAE